MKDLSKVSTPEALRLVADFLEANPEFEAACPSILIRDGENPKEHLRNFARKATRAFGGVDKSSSEYSMFFYVKAKIGEVTLLMAPYKEKVCQKVVEIVHHEEQHIPAQHRPAYNEEKVSYICGPSLLDEGEESDEHKD